MTSSTPNYITPKGVEKLKDEFRHLHHEERPKLVETIAWAASNGDRSENADYIYGKRRLRQIDSRLRFLGKRIENALVVDPTEQSGIKILFGATVSLENEDGHTQRLHIVGEDEIEAEIGKVSWKSPLAKSILGKKEGDEVLVKKPKGDEIIQILKVEYLEIP